MVETTGATDRGVGLTLLLGAVAVLAAAVAAVGAPEEIAAWGFAAAVAFSCLAVVAIHLYWE
ncbi:hypothetical protein [Halovivax sp.]|uniref:DUF7525 family protein n=1 Tax=Halovivax sp. TaxID=1935978 RepID=UPI0025C1D739|nr:hypothetical protein [Halovivax sp.]